MTIVKYELEDSITFNCLTRCEHNRGIWVGSEYCREVCSFCVGVDRKNKIVDCNYTLEVDTDDEKVEIHD